MRRAARTDGNQAMVVHALRSIGASVQHLHYVGGGCPDILVGYRGVNYLMEIKDGSKPPSARKLTPKEKAWHENWRGSVHVVLSAEEAINIITR